MKSSKLARSKFVSDFKMYVVSYWIGDEEVGPLVDR